MRKFNIQSQRKRAAFGPKRRWEEDIDTDFNRAGIRLCEDRVKRTDSTEGEEKKINGLKCSGRQENHREIHLTIKNLLGCKLDSSGLA